MSDTDIGALRQKLASRVRSDDYRQRRKDMDAAFSQYRIAPDVTVEPVTANGVRAEWTSTPQDDRDAALLWLHGGGYVLGSLDSHRHVVSEAGRAAKAWSLALDYRLAPEAMKVCMCGFAKICLISLRPATIVRWSVSVARLLGCTAGASNGSGLFNLISPRLSGRS